MVSSYNVPMLPSDKLTAHFRIPAPTLAGLKRLKIETCRDLLYHFPSRYGTPGAEKSIGALVAGDYATVYGKVLSSETKKAYHRKIPMAEVVIEDDTGRLRATWFHQAYLAKKVRVDSVVRMTGTVTASKSGMLYMANPEFDEVASLPHGGGDRLFDTTALSMLPVYPERQGVTTLWLQHHIKRLLAERVHETIEDPLTQDLLDKYHLPSLANALIYIHAPQSEKDAEVARKRFAFEEVFLLQLERLALRKAFQSEPAYTIPVHKAALREFESRFPFPLTGAQERAIAAIADDFGRGQPMLRLLEGDVGSGKTAVAAASAFAVIAGNTKRKANELLQVAYMSPTEILATQHFFSFIKYFEHLNVPIALLTGSQCLKYPSKLSTEPTSISRPQLIKWIANGEIPILFGTHTLIQKKVVFKNLAYVIIDEQHRFGIEQRKALHRGKSRIGRGLDADTLKTPGLLHEDLTYKVRGALFAVYNRLGGGHKELIYQRALAEELSELKIPHKREQSISILYNDKKIGTYQPDFIVDDKVVLELKALPFLGTQPKQQLWYYLKSSPFELGLLANFSGKELEIKRVVYEKARQKESASNPRQSALVPHLLSMTATPIPRTLALTVHGDLDLTLLDELPAGRKTIETTIVGPQKRKTVYEAMRARLAEGRQAFVICPRIYEPDPDKEMALEAKSVTAEAARLARDVFPEYKVAILHGKASPAEKERVMDEFLAHKADILVATSVVEVGVNVPNATVILIEGAEHFGLAQLHQLRGRVQRSSHQPYCYLATETTSQKSLERLRALEGTTSGFTLAEADLALRGAGELVGGKQWGVSDIAMDALKNLKLVEAARKEAQAIVEKQDGIQKHRPRPVHLE